MIYHAQEYHNDKGQTVIQHHIDEGIPPSDFPLFLAVGFIKAETPMGDIDHRIQVPIEAKTLTEAFDKFLITMEKEGPKYAEEFMESVREQARTMMEKQRQRIITPGQMPNPPMGGIQNLRG